MELIQCNPRRNPPPSSCKDAIASFSKQTSIRLTALTPEQVAIVAQALRILQLAESILLVEYIEAAIPFMNGIFIAVASQQDSALCSHTLREFHEDPHLLADALRHIFLYSSLQIVNLLVVLVLMKKRFNTSPVAHLAFTLQHHWAALLGNMLPWVIIVAHFHLVHYGATEACVITILLNCVTDLGLKRNGFLVSIRLRDVSRAQLHSISEWNKRKSALALW